MKSKILSFANKNGDKVFNPTVPFEHDGKRYMGIRAEPIANELESRTLFAYEIHKRPNSWVIDDSLGSLPLEDPAYMEINGKKVVLGVKVQREDARITYKTEFYVSDSIEGLEHFASGPVGMKDIRLVNLGDRIGVFTRPQGTMWGNGKIGYFEVGNLDELRSLSEGDWYSARIIDGLFGNGQWGGVNQALKLPQGEIGAIGHMAYKTTNKKGELVKHYCVMSFRYNPRTQTPDNIRTIAERKDFPRSNSKKSPELDDVVFPAGIDDSSGLTIHLYCGLSDFCIGMTEIEKPF